MDSTLTRSHCEGFGLLLVAYIYMTTCGCIVIVEDDRAIRETLQQLIESQGYGVRTACNGEEALALLKVLDTPCLILTDLMMPVMNGYEFIQLASQTHTIATIPIVIVSATPKESDLKVMSESGKIKGLIKKPFDCDYLMKVVVEHCGPPPSSHLQGIAGVLSTPISASR